MQAAEYDSTFAGFLPVFLEEPCKLTPFNPIKQFDTTIKCVICNINPDLDIGIHSGVLIPFVCTQ